LGRADFLCLGGLDASRWQLQSRIGLYRSSSELSAHSARFCRRRRDRRDGKRRRGLLADGSAGGRDGRCSTHFGAASRAGAADAQRTACGATANAIRANFRFTDGARGCSRCDAAARRGCGRARGYGFSRRRRVHDAASADRCRRARRSSENIPPRSVVTRPSREKLECPEWNWRFQF